MNMSPKVRPWWLRYPLMFGTSLLWLYKVLHLPRAILPRDFKAVVNNWTHEMFWELIRSRFKSAYIDQPCYFKMPTSFKPKAQVAPQHQLPESEIKKFYTQGFLGPFDAFSHDEMMDFKREVLALENEKSKECAHESSTSSPSSSTPVQATVDASRLGLDMAYHSRLGRIYGFR